MVALLLSISQVEGINTHHKGKYVETESTTQEMLNDVTFVPGEPPYSNDWGSMVQITAEQQAAWDMPSGSPLVAGLTVFGKGLG